MNEVECAWVAGLLEGEGSFVYVGRRSRNRVFPQINCAMTDEDVIRKLHSIVGVGYVHEDPGNNRQNPAYKMMWRWSVAKRDDVIGVLESIRPHLGARRGAKVDEILSHFAMNPPCYPKKVHGDRRMYATDGCRCELCRAAEAEYRKQLRASRSCSFPGCDQGWVGHGLCEGHNKQRRRGGPLTPINRKAVA